MKVVSRQYKNSMAQMLRNRGYAVVTFGNVDVTAITDGSWSGTQASWSSFKKIDYDYDFGGAVATLETNKWCLDGTSIILPNGTVNDGYISEDIGSTVIEKIFSDPHELVGITLTFDLRTDEWATEATITYLDSDGQDIDSVTVYPDAHEYSIEFACSNVYGIRISLAINIPTHRVRVEKVAWGVGRNYSNDELISVSQSHDIDPLSRRLPSEQLEFTIYDPKHEYDPANPKGIYAFINKLAPIMVQHGYDVADNGVIEWLKPDTYSLMDNPVFKNSKVTFRGSGIIGSLKDTFYKSKAGTKNLYDMAIEVLEDAGLPPTTTGEDPWDIDASLKNMYTNAILPIDTHMNCLQLIAHAARSRFYTDDNNIIHIKPFGVSVVGIFSGECSDNGHESFSTLVYMDTGSPATQTIATLELNRWMLDADSPQVILNDNVRNGFVSTFIPYRTFILDVSMLDNDGLG